MPTPRRASLNTAWLRFEGDAHLDDEARSVARRQVEVSRSLGRSTQVSERWSRCRKAVWRAVGVQRPWATVDVGRRELEQPGSSDGWATSGSVVVAMHQQVAAAQTLVAYSATNPRRTAVREPSARLASYVPVSASCDQDTLEQLSYLWRHPRCLQQRRGARLTQHGPRCTDASEGVADGDSVVSWGECSNSRLRGGDCRCSHLEEAR